MAVADSESVKIEEFKIPTYILVEAKVENVPEEPKCPECPVIVFINSKSGGQLGGDLLVTFRKLLNEKQVNLVVCEKCGRFLLFKHLFLS